MSKSEIMHWAKKLPDGLLIALVGFIATQAFDIKKELRCLSESVSLHSQAIGVHEKTLDRHEARLYKLETGG